MYSTQLPSVPSRPLVSATTPTEVTTLLMLLVSCASSATLCAPVRRGTQCDAETGGRHPSTRIAPPTPKAMDTNPAITHSESDRRPMRKRDTTVCSTANPRGHGRLSLAVTPGPRE